MTMAVPGAQQSEYEAALAAWNGDTGLEDFRPEDASVPRLSIDHDKGEFVDSQSGFRTEVLQAKMLGLVKQRLMWPTKMAEGNDTHQPLCKSTDFLLGFPQMSEKVTADLRFPWDASNFTQADLQKVPDSNLPALECGSCRFKEWNTNPATGTPWCSEVWTIPLLYWDGTSWLPAIWGLQRSGLKPTKKYISSFSAKKAPLFTAITRVDLDQNKKGRTTYYVPKYTMSEVVSPDQWPALRDDFIGIRDYLQAHPQDRDSEGNLTIATPDRVSGNDNPVIDLDASDPWGGSTVPGQTVGSPPPPPAAPAAPTPPPPAAAPAPANVAPAPAAPTPPPPAAPAAPTAPPPGAGTPAPAQTEPVGTPVNQVMGMQPLADDDEPPF